MALDQRPALRPDQRMTGPVPLEPRIMMDANLEWDLSSSTALTSALSGMVQAFAEQAETLEDLLETFESSAQSASALFGALGTVSDSQDLGPITETVDRLKDAFGGLRDAMQAEVLDLIGEDFAEQMANGINADLGSGFGIFAGDRFSTEDLAEVFNLGAFTEGTLTADIQSLLDETNLGTYTSDQVMAVFQDTLASVIGNGATFSVDFEDLSFGGVDILSFEQLDDDTVEVQVHLPEVLADLGAILTDMLPGLDFGDLPGAVVELDPITFTLESIVTEVIEAGTTTLTEVGFSIGEFAAPALLELGGTIETEALEMQIGFLGFSVEGLELLNYRLGLDIGAGADLGAVVDLTAPVPVLNPFATGLTFGVSQQVRGLGEADFTDVEADAVYDILSVDLEGSLAFGGTDQTVGASIVLSSLLDSAVSDDRVQAFFEAFDVGVTIDTSGLGLSPEVAEALEQSIIALSALTAEDISVFLEAIRQMILDVLTSAAFDVDIPLTDLNLTAFTDALSDAVDTVFDTLLVATEAVGSAVDSVTETVTALTATTLDAVAEIETVTIELSDEGGAVETVEITLDPTVLGDADQTVEARSTALAESLSAALADYGLAVTAAGGLLSLGSSIPGVPVPSLAIVGASRTSSSDDEDEDSGLDLSTLSLADLGVTVEGAAEAASDLASDLGLPTSGLAVPTFNDLVDLVTEELQGILPGALLELSEEGAIIFRIDGLGAEVDLSTQLDIDNLGLGDIAGLSLAGTLEANIFGEFSGAVGLDLTTIASALIDGVPTSLDEAEGAFGDLTELVLESTFLEDVALTAGLSAQALGITGEADLGLIAVEIGADDPSQNGLVMAAEFGASLIGGNAVDGYSNRVTVQDFIEVVTSDDPVAALTGMIGQLDLAGVIETDGAGRGLDTSGDPVVDLRDLSLVDPFGYTGDGSLSQVLLQLGDVNIEVAGIGGLNEGLIDGVTLTIDDLTNPVDTVNWALLGDAAAVLDQLEGLTDIGSGDILDSLTSIANLLEITANTLSDKLPFLEAEIPILNFSILDQLDFATDFLTKLQEIRDNPQDTLDGIKTVLEQVFGQDTVTMNWDAETKVLDLGLSFGLLEDAAQSLPFELDLVQLLADQVGDFLPEAILDFASGFVTAGASGELIFAPSLTLDFAFGLDLAPLLATPTDVATRGTPVTELATVGTLNNARTGEDITITVVNERDGTETIAGFSVRSTDTISEALGRLHSELNGYFSNDIHVNFDPEFGQIFIGDHASPRFDTDGIEALFGASHLGSTEVDGRHQVAVNGAPSAGGTFTLQIGEEALEITVESETGRDSAGFANAINDALAATELPRSALGGSGLGFGIAELTAGHAVVALVEDGALVLAQTNFAEVVGYDAAPVGFTVMGQDLTPEYTLTFTENGGSNAARLLGLETGVTASAHVSEPLYQSVDRGAPRIFIDTETSGINFTFEAGASEGLNLGLGLGPFQIMVVNGKALLNAGDGSGDPARLTFGINDIDGDAHVGEYDITHLKTISSDDDLDFTDLLDLDIQVGIDLDLPFQDTVGIFNAAEHGLSWQTQLVSLVDGAHWSDLDIDNITETFAGELPSLFAGEGVNLDALELRLPDLGDILSQIDVLALLNDPKILLGGIDTIMGEVGGFLDDFLGDIDLPLVGDALGSGLSFFDDVRYSVVQPALAWANTPGADGQLPTVVDLVTDFMNEQLNSVLGTEDISYLQAHLETSGGLSNSYLYGVLNFSGVIFSEMMDIDFDFGLPGLNLEVEEGSQILMELDYTVNLGFGVDRNGFFLLNDTDQAEVGIEFTVDAGTFQGSMNILRLMGLSAKAVTLDADGNVISDASTDGGTAMLRAFLEADLFGEDGREIQEPGDGKAVTQSAVFRSFDQVTPVDGNGNALDYERLVYVHQLDFGQLITIDFGAEIEISIGVVGNILNPLTEEPIELAGRQILPNMAAELVLDAGFTLQEGLSIDKFGINNVRLDASQMYEALIAPLVDPIMDFVGPLLDVIDIIFQPPLELIKDLAVELIAIWFPIARLANDIASVANSVAQFVGDIAENGGLVHFGSFDFTSYGAGLSSGTQQAQNIDLNSVGRSGFNTATSKPEFGSFGNTTRGFSVDIPLIQDPFGVISALLGDFSDIELVRARYQLFNIDSQDLDFTSALLDELPVPGWAESIIRTVADRGFGVQNRIEGHGITKFEMGYDLSGVQNFLGSYDPLRLFDGVFIEAGEGGFVDIDIDFTMLISGAIAGLSGTGSLDFALNLTDPDGDGKVRLSELMDVIIYMLKQGAITPHQQIGYLTEGSLQFGVSADVFFGWTDVELFNLEMPEIELGLYNQGPDIADLDDDGGAVLAIGSRISSSNTTMTEDGDDILTFDGFDLSLEAADGSLDGALDSGLTSLVIPAGEGNNTIDMSSFGNNRAAPAALAAAPAAFRAAPAAFAAAPAAFSTASAPTSEAVSAFAAPAAFSAASFAAPVALAAAPSLPSDPDADRVTITYTGAGNDTITLPTGGLNVMFLGGGDDVITAPEGSVGTYVVFAEGGADQIDIPGGNVIVFSGQDFGMRDVFLTEFAEGGISADAVRDLLGLDQNNLPDDGASGFYDIGASDRVNLATLLERYTEATQNKAHSEAETITVGTGNHILLTGKGADTITGDLDGMGNMHVLSGAGDDILSIGGTRVMIEGGAGSDLITVNGDTTEVWGWGAAAGEAGLQGSTSQLDALARRDGEDTLIGGSGHDALHGQLGSDLIEGRLGNDTISGGHDRDLISGGNLEIVVDGTAVATAQFNPGGGNGTLTISTAALADGDDVIRAGTGDDIAFGGGGADNMSGNSGGDILVGDFADLSLLGTFVTQSLISQELGSALEGRDTIDGGGMDDVLVAGGDRSGGQEQLSDLLGDNLLVGDYADVEGPDLLAMLDRVDSVDHRGGGNDALTTGRGNDTLVGGEGDDDIDAGLGVDLITGDNIRLDLQTLRMTAQSLDTDGNDSIRVGTDQPGAGDPPVPADQNDLIIGGRGNDTVTAADGDLVFVGDGGWIQINSDAWDALEDYEEPGTGATAEQLAEAQAARILFDALAEETRTQAHADDGNDTATVAGGKAHLLMGGGNDSVAIADGESLVLGDDGVLRTALHSDGTSYVHSLESRAPLSATGRDTISGAAGYHAFIGGDDNDNLSLGTADGLILGDRGVYRNPTPDRSGLLTSDSSLTAGNDRITSGSGDAIIIAGLGNDTVQLGHGDDVATGDDAEAVLDRVPTLDTLTPLHRAHGGDDVLTALGTVGDNIMMGQSGDDSLVGGLSDDIMLGDNGLLELLASALSGTNQSPADRITLLQSSEPLEDGDDTLLGHAGADTLVAGFGRDLLRGGTEQDLLIGDTVTIWRTFAIGTDSLSATQQVDTTFAFTIGGYDLLHGEEGADIMVGNLGPDLFFGNTAEDAIFSDGLAGFFTTDWGQTGFGDPMPHWALIRVNFAGPDAVDVVSEAQSESAIGHSLDRTTEQALERLERLDHAALNERFAPAPVSPAQLSEILDLATGEDMLSAIAEMISLGLDSATLQQSIAAALSAHMSSDMLLDTATLTLLLERIMPLIEARLEQFENGAPLALAAE